MDYTNLSFGFFRYENRQGLESKFVDLFERNSQVAIFENKSAKFDREVTCFRVKKPKTQVTKSDGPNIFGGNVLILRTDMRSV